jgi:hypothetical protein
MTCDGSVVFMGTPISSAIKTDRQDIAEILLKVVLSTINKPTNRDQYVVVTNLYQRYRSLLSHRHITSPYRITVING